MAGSGYLEARPLVQGRGIRFEWEKVWQSVENNQTNISWKLFGIGSEGWVKSGGFIVRIDGRTVCEWEESNRINLYPNQIIASGNITLNHDDNGNKSFSVHIEGSIYEYARNTWGDTNFTLDNIARASTPSCITYPNNTYNIGQLGDTITIHTNRKGNFTHTVRYDLYGLSGVIATNVTNNCAWKIPEESFAQKFFSYANQMEGTIYLDTFYGGKQIGTRYCKFSVKLPYGHIPSISDVTLELDNSENATVKSWGIGVKGFSKIKITATGEGIYNSTISGYDLNTSINIGVNHINGTPLSFTSEIIQSDGVFNCTARTVDTRGRFSKYSENDNSIVIYPYRNPTLSGFSVARNTTNAKKIMVNTSWEYSSVNGNNSVTVTLKYKKKTSTGWSTYTGTLQNGVNELEGEFDETSSYDFSIVVTDALGNSTSRTESVSTINVLLDFKAGGKGLGIGKVAETDAMEIALPIKIADEDGNLKSLIDYLMPVGYIIWSVALFDPNELYKGTEWVRIKNRFLWAEGDNNNAEFLGGSDKVTLSVDNMPSHTHAFKLNTETDGGYLPKKSNPQSIITGRNQTSSTPNGTFSDRNGSWSNIRAMGNTGNGQAFSIMPPYISAFCWKRIA